MSNSLTSTTQYLLELAHDGFRSEVDKDLRPPFEDDHPDVIERWETRHAALRSPALADRWFMVLSQMAKSVDGQLAARMEDYESQKASLRAKLISAKGPEIDKLRKQLEELKAEYSRSRAGTLRFKSGLDEALIEARAARDSVRDRLYDSVVAEERNRYAAEVNRLVAAIRAHQDTAEEEDYSPEPHDERLWAAIERSES